MILEAIPNFSEGRRADVCETIAAEARLFPVKVLGLEMDRDHNRSVLTFAGEAAAVGEASFAAARKAVDLIDLNSHQGQHPRMGAIDVLPFVPLQEALMADAVDLARAVGRRIGEELGVPVFLYESAATRPDRRNLADIRKPQFEGLRELIGKDPGRVPDFGPNLIHFSWRSWDSFVVASSMSFETVAPRASSFSVPIRPVRSCKQKRDPDAIRRLEQAIKDLEKKPAK